MNIINLIENEHISDIMNGKIIPKFKSGDTLKISVKVIDGARERIQVFEGICIARRSSGINSSFTVRKVSYGEAVERRFPLYSPKITNIEVLRRGKVRRAKLYYLRSLRGKAARILELIDNKHQNKLESAISMNNN